MRSSGNGVKLRRKLLLALLASPIALARAQPTARGEKQVRVAILTTARSMGPQDNIRQFVDAMAELGWIEGRNVVYERVYAEGDEKRLPALAAALVSRRPDLIYLQNNPEALAALAATSTIPIVFASPNEPVESGIVKSLARPGGNATGVAAVGPETGVKRMQLLKEALPKIRRVGLLMKPGNLREVKLIEQAAGAERKIIPAIMNEPEELNAAFSMLAENRAEAVITAQVAFLVGERKRVVDLATKQRSPVIGHRSEHAEVGALMSYNSSLLEQRRRAARLVDKVLKGAKPADIPVEQPTKFELVVNLKTARALGLTIPPSLLARADQVIE